MQWINFLWVIHFCIMAQVLCAIWYFIIYLVCFNLKRKFCVRSFKTKTYIANKYLLCVWTYTNKSINTKFNLLWKVNIDTMYDWKTCSILFGFMNERRENKKPRWQILAWRTDMFRHGQGNLPIVGIVVWFNKGGVFPA